jgi:hypothetical protein
MEDSSLPIMSKHKLPVRVPPACTQPHSGSSQDACNRYQIQKSTFFSGSEREPPYVQERLPYTDDSLLVGKGARALVYKTKILGHHFIGKYGVIAEVNIAPENDSDFC